MASNHQTIETTAAEYVLGTLRGSDRDIFEARLREDIALQHMVARWEMMLTPLVAAVLPTEPPAGVWHRISETLGFAAEEGASQGPAGGVAAKEPPVQVRPQTPKTAPPAPHQPTRSGTKTTRPAYGAAIGERLSSALGARTAPTDGDSGASDAGSRSDRGDAKRGPAFIVRKAAPEEDWLHPNLEARVTGLERRVRRWRMAAFIVGGLACLLALIFLFTETEPPRVPATGLSAVLSPVDAAPVWTIRYSEDERQLQADSIQPGPELPDQSYELWVLMPDSGPLSLGLLPAGRQTRLTPPTQAFESLGGGVPLAVTIEPDGGSPTGQPTGPIVHTGRLESLAPTF